jgi:outer membrane immunogenic protein
MRLGDGIVTGSALLWPVSTVRAADLGVYRARPAVAPIYSWAGFYLGGYVGGVWGDPDVQTSDGLTFVTNTTTTAAGLSPLVSNRSAFGGVQLGYNWQSGPFVYGLETDLSVTRLQSTAIAPPILILGNGQRFSNINASGTASIDWFGTVRARLGYAWNGVLVYGTGGLAYADVHAQNTATQTAFFQNGGLPPAANMASGTGTSDASKIKLGWTAGGGVDIQLGYNWILNLTYLHVGIDNLTATNGFAFADGTGRSSTGTSTTSASFKFDTYRVGLSHKFSL